MIKAWTHHYLGLIQGLIRLLSYEVMEIHYKGRHMATINRTTVARQFSNNNLHVKFRNQVHIEYAFHSQNLNKVEQCLKSPRAGV